MISHGFSLSTDLFETTTPGPHFINPHCFGEDFANWLIANIHNPTFALSTPPQEDFGWVILVTHHEQVFTLSIAIMDDSPGMVPAEWRVDLSFEKPLNGLRTWFRKPPQDSLDALAGIIETTLRSEPRFTRLTRV